MGPKDALITDMNTSLGNVIAAVATLTAQMNANAKQVDENDKIVKEVIVTHKVQVEELRTAISGQLGQIDPSFDNLQNSVMIQRKTM